MSVALTRGADLTLTSLGRYLPGFARVKSKIKRVDRALANPGLFHDLPRIQQQLTRRITASLPFCVIAVDWTGWHDRRWHLLRASLICDGRAIPLMSEVVSAELAQNSAVQCAFLDRLHAAIPDGKAVTVITDAGFRTDWFRHVASLGWTFIGRVRGCIGLRLDGSPHWIKISELKASDRPRKAGCGVLARKPRSACRGSFYLHKRPSAGRHGQGRFTKTTQEHRRSAQEPWLLFSNAEKLSPRQVMKLYSRRMQIEQNFRDEKSPRTGYGLRLSRSQGLCRLSILGQVAAIASLLMWLTGYQAEKKNLHLQYQASSEKGRRVLSYLSLAENLIRHAPTVARKMTVFNALKTLGKEYSNMVMIY